MGKLTGKTALITGGGTGIGSAIAERFHHEGAYVVISGRRLEKLRETAEKISPSGDRTAFITADITVDAECRRVVEETAALTGSLSIIVNNAGIMRFGKLHETPLEEWDAMMRTNTWGPWRLMVYAVPFMKAGGSIINISSIAGIKALAGAGIYCTSKAALQMVSQVMAMEAAAYNVRVNLILPGLVEGTELADPIFGKDNVPDFYNRLRGLHPLGRNGRPADIADAALFLASDESSWITGVILNVDGGRHLATNRPADV